MRIDISFLFKIWEWIKSSFKSLFKSKKQEDFRQEITDDIPKGEIVGYVYHGCDYRKVLETIETWHDVNVFKEAYKKWDVKEGKGGISWNNGHLNERHTQEGMIICSYALEVEDEESFRKELACRIEDCKAIIEMVDQNRSEERKKQKEKREK